MNKKQIKSPQIILNKLPQIRNLNNDNLNSLSINCKFEENINEEEIEENKEENKKIISRIKQIFISKTNSSKFSYHPLISYSVGHYSEYILYLKTIFVEIKIYKNGIFQKIEKTYFNPYSNSFCVNYDNLSFIFYIYYNQVQIFKDFKEKYFIYSQPELKKIRKNCIDLNNINLSKNQNDSFLLNNSILDSGIFFNKESIKNPFDVIKEKKLYFSCKYNDKLLEITFGFEKIFLNGFFEAKENIKLSYNDNLNIDIPIESFIFLEIQINSNIKQIKKDIHKKIQILRLLGFLNNNIFFIGVLYNTLNNIFYKNNKDDDIDTQNTSNEEKEKMNYEDNNFKIFIYNCDTYFLGQKISFVRRIFSRDFTHEKDDLLKSKNNGKRFSVKSNRKTSIDQGFRSSLFSIQKNEQIDETNKIIQELKEIKKIKEEENKQIIEYTNINNTNTNTINNTITINNTLNTNINSNNTNNVNHKDNKSKNYALSILKSLSNNFSLFDDDILFSQMNIF